MIPGTWEIDLLPFGKTGPRYRRKFVGTSAEAYVREAEMLQAMRRQVRRNPSLAEILADFLASYRIDHQPSTVKNFEDAWVHLKTVFGQIRMAEIIPSDVDTYKRKRLGDGVKKRTINKELSYLSGMLKWAEEQGHVSNPIRPKRFPSRQAEAPRPRIPEAAAIEKMIAAIEPKYRTLLLLIYDLGLRISEAKTLQGKDVDLDNGLVFIRGKGDKERVLPITTTRLKAALKAERREGYLFTNPRTNKPWYGIRKALLRAASAAGIEGRVYHHLMRHSFTTYGHQAGVDIYSLQGMLGHSTVATTQRYAHLQVAKLKAEVAKIEKIRASIGGGSKQRNQLESKRKMKRHAD